MPKRGGRGRWDVQRSYDGHDDRSKDNIRRVRIDFNKRDSNISRNAGGKFKVAWERLLYDGDVEMSGGASGLGRGNFRGFRGRGGRRDGRMDSPAPRQFTSARRLTPGLSSWYQVTIPYGHKHNKDVILRSLLSAVSPDIFIPHYYKVVGNSSIFYVDDFAMAEKLFDADKKVTMSDGFRLIIKVRPGTPQVTVDDTLKEKMKLAMVKRYNPAVKALDLTKFHSDPDLTEVFCPLFRPNILLSVIDIIVENIPELEALNLSGNGLNRLEHLKVVPEKLKCLKILYMGKNKLQHQRALESLKGVPLVELLLEGNPFVDRFKDKELYASEIRRIFPKLTKLDNNMLPPTIGFDIAEQDTSLPPPQASFLCDVHGQNIVKQFIEQYYALYDSESRQPLLEAYHESAMISINSTYSHGQSQSTTNNRLNDYFPLSRNLMRNTDREYRRRHLKIGRLQVVSFLCDLPKTQHDPQSFTIDLSIFTQSLLVLTINGVFKEKTGNPAPIRAFHRTMVIVPNNGGFCIINDMIFISNASKYQEETSFKDTLPILPPSMPAAPVHPVVLDEAAKLHLVQAICQQTGMNIHWSTICLEQTNWDLTRGFSVFSELHKEGKIPPEAFVK